MASEVNKVLWQEFFDTPKEMTKRIPGGANLTAIDPYYRIMRMTEVFGPMGINWGVKDEVIKHIASSDPHGDLMTYQGTLFYRIPKEDSFGDLSDEVGEIPIHASIYLWVYISSRKEYRREDDPVKKVATDALTKGLSKIGMSGDVYLAKFLHTKYAKDFMNDGTNQHTQTPKPQPSSQQKPQGKKLPAFDGNVAKEVSQELFRMLRDGKSHEDLITHLQKSYTVNSQGVKWVRSLTVSKAS